MPRADAFFVRERRARSDAARRIVELIASQHAAWEAERGGRLRRRRSVDQSAHELMVEALICNAVHAQIGQPGQAVAIGMGRGRPSRYSSPPYEPLGRLLGGLGQDGIGALQIVKGGRFDNSPSRLTTFTASPALITSAASLTYADLGRRAGGETVTLKNTKSNVAMRGSAETSDPFETWAATGAAAGEQIDYADNATADGLRQEMHRVNEALDAADIAFVGSAPNEIDVGDRWLRRVFSNGWVDFRHGGRLAGGFWMDLPSQHRRGAIRLNGEKVAELDYGSMAMRLLYARSKHPLPAARDPYCIAGLPSSTRVGVKTVLSSLLYGDTALRRWPKGCARYFKGFAREDVIAAVLREHNQVRDMLGTMVGFDITRTESDIMVAVLLRIIDAGGVALPIHDAILIPLSQVPVARSIMLDTFTEYTGAEGVISQKR